MKNDLPETFSLQNKITSLNLFLHSNSQYSMEKQSTIFFRSRFTQL